MLSPRTIKLLLRHFDSIDEAVSVRLCRKRPWQEEALTAILCDLLDAETQAEENISYNLNHLREDLARSDEPVGLRLRIDTHQYPKHLERWVTQADFGLIINYQDQFNHSHSSRTAWLMQAKRIFPNKYGQYDTNSKFESKDHEQDARIKILQDWGGEEFIRYFLYCPRPKRLLPSVREALNQSRTNALAGDIFDYTLGLELRDDMLSDSPTISAGLFVASLDGMPKTLQEVHASIFEHTTPFSWFLVQHLVGNSGHIARSRRSLESIRATNPGYSANDIEQLIRGDHRVLDGIDLPKSLNADTPPRILPAHTIEISVVCGLDRPQGGV
jgi:hypothetical protein